MIAISYVPVIPDTHPKNLSIYQFYYLYGFERIGAPVRFPWNRFGLEYRIRSSGLGQRLIRTRYNLVVAPGVGSGEVGTYALTADGRTVRFAIDASDHAHVVSDAAYEWCDVYFKASRWESRPYPPKVRPVVFGHNYLTAALFARLKAYRTAPKTMDVVFINRILGGSEHNIRLFEALAAIDCRRLLICSVQGYERPEHLDRLRAAGVTITRWIDQDAYWQAFSRGRLVFNRSGRKLSMTWKTSALLCMGAAIVFDDRPRPNWPVPLEPERHYIDCGLGLSDDRESADALAAIDYSKVRRTIEAALADEPRIRRIAAEGAGYYDRHAAPERVADYIVRECLALT